MEGGEICGVGERCVIPTLIIYPGCSGEYNTCTFCHQSWCFYSSVFFKNPFPIGLDESLTQFFLILFDIGTREVQYCCLVLKTTRIGIEIFQHFDRKSLHIV